MYRHLLVPLDGSDLSIEAVSSAVNLARTLGARVSFLHVPEHDAASANGDGAPMHPTLKGELAHAYQDRARAQLTKAESAARALGVPCNSLIRTGEATLDVILDTARGAGCDLIFMASSGRGAAMCTATPMHTLLAATDLPILVSPARDGGHMHPVIVLIRDKYRSLATVLHAWLNLLGRCHRHGLPADTSLMRAMADYIAEFPQAMHQPLECDYLFTVLRERTAVVHAELDELERQHERERAMAEALTGLVDGYGQGKTTIAQLLETVDTYARFMWEHMGRVEAVILPAAQRYLSEADWNDVEAASQRQGGPRIAGEQHAVYQQLLSRIDHLAP